MKFLSKEKLHVKKPKVAMPPRLELRDHVREVRVKDNGHRISEFVGTDTFTQEWNERRRYEIDAGRAITHMQLVAWEQGIGSCIYTVKEPSAVALLGVPDDFHLALVAGFGYPTREVAGRKDRRPLDEIAFRNRFGEPLALSG